MRKRLAIVLTAVLLLSGLPLTVMALDETQATISTTHTDIAEECTTEHIESTQRTTVDVINPFGTRSNDKITDLFPDPGLQQIVAAALGRTVDSDVTLAELDNIFILNQGLIPEADRLPVNSLDGIEQVPNIISLFIYHGSLEHLDKLSGCPNLYMLTATNLGLKDISGLNSMTNLVDIDLSHNQIQDMTTIANLPGIRSITLRHNNIDHLPNMSSMSSAISMPSLLKFDVSYNPLHEITNINTISKDIDKLYLSGLPLTSLNDFTMLTGVITMLEVGDLGLTATDLNLFSSINGLDSLRLPNNNITTISAANIAGLNLSTLSLKGNAVKDVSGLESYFGTDDIELNLEALDLLYASDIPYASSVTLPVDLVGFNGSSVDIISISNGGVHNPTTNQITWSNINSSTTYVEYSFESYVGKRQSWENPSDPATPVKYFSGTVRLRFPSQTTYTVTYDSNGANSGVVPIDTNGYLINAPVTVLGNTGSLAKQTTNLIVGIL